MLFTTMVLLLYNLNNLLFLILTVFYLSLNLLHHCFIQKPFYSVVAGEGIVLVFLAVTLNFTFFFHLVFKCQLQYFLSIFLFNFFLRFSFSEYPQEFIFKGLHGLDLQPILTLTVISEYLCFNCTF